MWPPRKLLARSYLPKLVAIAASEFSADTLYITIAHESIHVGNIFLDRVFMALGAQGYTTTLHDAERSAYRVSSLISQAAGEPSFTTASGAVLWNSTWNQLDAKVLETNRSAAVESQLSNLGIGENDAKGKNIAFPGGGRWR